MAQCGLRCIFDPTRPRVTTNGHPINGHVGEHMLVASMCRNAQHAHAGSSVYSIRSTALSVTVKWCRKMPFSITRKRIITHSDIVQSIGIIW
jgi:hypothetical protein